MAIIFYHEGLLMVQRGSPSDFPILRYQGGGQVTPPIPTIDGSEVALRRVKRKHTNSFVHLFNGNICVAVALWEIREVGPFNMIHFYDFIVFFYGFFFVLSRGQGRPWVKFLIYAYVVVLVIGGQ